jgi:hypothetical protein
MGRKHEKGSTDKSMHDKGAEKRESREPSTRNDSSEKENPPRTTSHGWLTTPKFGSSTSGGGEIEPGPERD